MDHRNRNLSRSR